MIDLDKPLQLRNGVSAKFIYLTKQGDITVALDRDGTEVIAVYKRNGLRGDDDQTMPDDLINAPPQPFEFYINVGDTYITKNEAVMSASEWAVFRISRDAYDNITTTQVHDGRIYDDQA